MADMTQKIFTAGEIMKLCKSYRPTSKITSFTQKTQSNNELEPIIRYGEHPRILQFRNTKERIQSFTDLVSSFRNSHYTSLGIICKTESQAEELAQKPQSHTDRISLLPNQNSAYIKGIIIISAHMAKGLEFDEVIIP